LRPREGYADKNICNFHQEDAMNQYRIAVVVGSLRKDSFNRKLASAIVKLAPSEFSFKQVQIGDLPFPEPAITPLA
jgi:hypothetical protein